MSEPFTRKFPRVRLFSALSDAFTELRAHVVWPNQEVSNIIDLSYKGLAVLRPALHEVTLRQDVSIDVELGGHKFAVSGQVVWATTEAVGVEIQQLSAEGHKYLGDFIDANLLGTQLRVVNQQHLTIDRGFDFWFQGPTGTHVLIWLSPDRKVVRVQIDLNGQTLEFSSGKRPAPGPLLQPALLLLSQIDKTQVPMEEFLRTLGS